jgi:hypothetical protein
MAQVDFFSNLEKAQKSLADARAKGLIDQYDEEQHMIKMVQYYEAINAKKAAGRDWDLKNQTVLQNIAKFGKQMVEDAQNLKDAKKSLKKSAEEIKKLEETANKLEQKGNKLAADMVKKKKAQLELEKEIAEVNLETANSTKSRLGGAMASLGKIGGVVGTQFGFIGDIFKGILGTAWNLGKALFDIILPIERAWKMFLEMQKVVGNVAADIGLTYSEYRILLRQMPTLYNEIIGYGGKIEDIGKIIAGFSNETGKNRLFSKEEITDIVKLGYSTGLGVEGVTNMVAEFDNLGLSLGTTMKTAEKGRQVAAKFNINQTKLLKTTTDVVKNLTGTAFGRSVEDLTKLAAKAESLRFNLAESINSFKDAFFSPEKAVEAAARIQVLGGEMAQQFGDPFSLMYESMNNADGMAEKLIASAKDLAVKNKNGEFIIPPAQRQILREQAEALGQNYDQIVNAAIEQAKVGDKMISLAKSGASLTGFDDDQKQQLANLMTLNKSGQYEIKMPNGVSQLVSNITSEDQLKSILAQRKASETAAQNRLTLQERLNIVLDRFAIGLTPLFGKLNEFLEDEGTLKKIEDLGKGIADKLIPFIDELFTPGGRLDKGIRYLLDNFNGFLTEVKTIMDGKGSFWEKIKGIFGSFVDFATKTILPYVQYVFGNIFTALKDIPGIGEALGLAGEQLIAKSFQVGKDKDGNTIYNKGTVGMAGGINEANKLLNSANKNQSDAESNNNFFTRAGAGVYNFLAGTVNSARALGNIIQGDDEEYNKVARDARINFQLSGAQTVDAIGGMFDWNGKDEGAAGLFGYDKSAESLTRDILRQDKSQNWRGESYGDSYQTIDVKDAMVYANGQYIKGGKGDAVAFLDEMAFGQAYKNSMGAGSDTTITVNVSGVIEHDSPNGKKSVTAKELYDSDPQMFGQFIKATMSKNDYGSGNYIVDFGVVPI